MSKNELSSLVEQFTQRGGQVQKCPDRTAQGGGSHQRRRTKKKED